MPSDWVKDSGFPGLFDAFVFDEVVFDAFYEFVPDEVATGDWTKQTLISGSWVPESSAT